jgi:glutamyl-Q tRNA(Asp) synthetase
VPNEPIRFIDGIQGEQHINLNDSIGDFVIKRRDRLFAYQLAVVVDDTAQHITDVVRGADLLSNTPRQIALQHALGLAMPKYSHLPVATDLQGLKLSKSTQAAALSLDQPVHTLWQALHFLRQDPPTALQQASLHTVWEWAFAHWNKQPLIGLTQITLY